ncbi:MAG: FAD-dependent oxidoreductase [Planctomycetota bacterium]
MARDAAPHQPGPLRGCLDDLGSCEFDVVVIGGGIYGVCTALEAARRGAKTALVESDDFGGATSWSSHRIVHGGLRYLQSLDLPRFTQSVRERRWFLETMPTLIEPLECLMPLSGPGLKRPIAFRAALAINAIGSRLVGGKTSALADGRVLSRRATLAAAPFVPERGLLGGGLWWDARMISSERVLIVLLRAACEMGAVVSARVRALRVLAEGGRVRGLSVESADGSRRVDIAARAVINCAGSGVLDEALVPEQADRTKLFAPARAFNLLLDVPPPTRSAIAVGGPARDAPTLFLVPMDGMLAAGTWHEPAEPTQGAMPTSASIDRFLEEIRAAVPGLDVSAGDIRCVWSGLLPAHSPGKGEPSDRPVVLDHGRSGGSAGHVTVSGVKYTTARLVAEQAVRRVFAGDRPAPVPVLQDPLGDLVLSTAMPSDRAVLIRLLERLRDEEQAVSPEDVLLRRTRWYLGEVTDAFVPAASQVFGLGASSVERSLDDAAVLRLGPLISGQAGTREGECRWA